MTSNPFGTLIELLSYRAEVSSTKAAFTLNGTPCTFEELWHGVNNFAALIQKLGIERHECVVVAIPNSKEFFVAFYGIQRAGGIAVLIFPGSGVDGRGHAAVAAHLVEADYVAPLRKRTGPAHRQARAVGKLVTSSRRVELQDIPTGIVLKAEVERAIKAGEGKIT